MTVSLMQKTSAQLLLELKNLMVVQIQMVTVLQTLKTNVQQNLGTNPHKDALMLIKTEYKTRKTSALINQDPNLIAVAHKQTLTTMVSSITLTIVQMRLVQQKTADVQSLEQQTQQQ